MVRLKLQADSNEDQKVEVTFKKNYLLCGVQNGIATTGRDESSPSTGLDHSQDSKFDFIPSSKKTSKA